MPGSTRLPYIKATGILFPTVLPAILTPLGTPEPPQGCTCYGAPGRDGAPGSRGEPGNPIDVL